MKDVFCRIIDKEIPSTVIYEDDDVIAILDISQVTKGHTLVMPKKHYDNFLEMPDDEYASLMKKAKKVANKVIDATKANGCNVLINTNAVAGQTIMHTHVHIIPRYDDSDTIDIGFSENEYDLNEVLNQIL